MSSKVMPFFKHTMNQILVVSMLILKQNDQNINARSGFHQGIFSTMSPSSLSSTLADENVNKFNQKIVIHACYVG